MSKRSVISETGALNQAHVDYESRDVPFEQRLLFMNPSAAVVPGSGTGVHLLTCYDDLHRLTQSRRSISGGTDQVINYSFDASGNLKSKSDYASDYDYQPARPNAVDSVTLITGGIVNFSYDGNGNMTIGHDKTLTYNAFNKPVTITTGSSSTEFSYGADLMRYRQDTNGGERTYYLGKLMEIVKVGTTTDYRHYLSDGNCQGTCRLDE